MTDKRKKDKGAPAGASGFGVDLAKLADFPADWAAILSDWRKGKVDKAAVVRALEAGHPVPAEANLLIAGLVDGSVKATPGNKKLDHPPRWMDSHVARTVASIQTMLLHPDRIPDEYGKQWRDWLGALRSRSNGTTNEKALEATAELFGCTTRRVRESVTRTNAKLKAIADDHGVTVADVKRVQRYGEP